MTEAKYAAQSNSKRPNAPSSKNSHHPRLTALLNYYDEIQSKSKLDLERYDSQSAKVNEYDKDQTRLFSPKQLEQNDASSVHNNENLREVDSDEIFEFLEDLKWGGSLQRRESEEEQELSYNTYISEYFKDGKQNQDLARVSNENSVLGTIENINSPKFNKNNSPFKSNTQNQAIFHAHVGKEYHRIGRAEMLSLEVPTSSEDSDIEAILESQRTNNYQRRVGNENEYKKYSNDIDLDEIKSEKTFSDKSESKIKKQVRFSNGDTQDFPYLVGSTTSTKKEKEYIYFPCDSDDISDQVVENSEANKPIRQAEASMEFQKSNDDRPSFTGYRRGNSSLSVWNKKQIDSLGSTENQQNGGSILLGNQAVPVKIDDITQLEQETSAEKRNIQKSTINGVDNIIKGIINGVQSANGDIFGDKFNNTLLLPIAHIIAVDLWSDQKDIVRQALRNLAESATVIERKQEILDCGGHLAIIISMKKWSTSPDVVVDACHALERAARFASFFADAVVRIGGLEVILYFMKEYISDERVQTYGCSALCALSWSRQNAETFVFKLQGIIAFQDAMTFFPFSTQLLLNACWFFHHVSAWPEFRSPAVSAGVLGSLSNAIETYTSDSNDEKIIQLNAREALKRLVSI